MTTEQVEGWAVLELMGHRRLGGYVTEATIFGVAMCRIDIPAVGETAAATQFYGGAAIYALTPTTEAIARAVAESFRPAPVERWQLPALEAPRSRGGYEDDDVEAEELPYP